MTRQQSHIITTGDVAAHCHVTYETVKNWIKRGKLNAFETPGHHHRIRIEDFNAFLETYGMPAYITARDRARRILIVDDQEPLTRSITDFFTKAGYECASASDGFEAGVQVLSFRPDLVILDLFMPQMDGFTVCQKIKADAATKHIRVLAITGHADEENLARIEACGADDILVKPFKLKLLHERVDTLFTPRTRKPKAISR